MTSLERARSGHVTIQDKPVTVLEAIAAYRLDRIANEVDHRNADRLMKHIPPKLGAKLVAALVQKDTLGWRNELVAAGMKRQTVNRTATPLISALILADKLDPCITITSAWKLPRLPNTATARNVVLSDHQVRDVIREAYRISPAFGRLVEFVRRHGCAADPAPPHHHRRP